jgi:hypothetical protein
MPQMDAHAHELLGRLLTPRCCSRLEDHGPALLWACDNDCFNGLDPRAWLRMIDRAAAARDRGQLLWCAVPDVVAHASSTRELFERWAPELEQRRLPLAYVLQDGLERASERARIPWERLAAVFVGGTDDFKEGATARRLVAEAKARGLQAHMGRVNSDRRTRIAHAFGCDSIDGTSHVTHRDRYLNRRLEQLASLNDQLELA